MRRRSSIRTSHAEVEHAPGGLPLAQQQPGAAAAAAAAAAQQQQQQRRHYVLLFCPNTDTDTGPEAGNKLARTQAHTPGPGVGCCAPVSVTSPLFIALAQSPPRPGPSPPQAPASAGQARTAHQGNGPAPGPRKAPKGPGTPMRKPSQASALGPFCRFLCQRLTLLQRVPSQNREGLALSGAFIILPQEISFQRHPWKLRHLAGA
jgi:hypothetical protein